MLLLAPALVRADYLPLSGAEVANNIAEIMVDDDAVRIQLEVFVRDSREFADLIPNDWLSAEAPNRASEAKRLAAFAETGLSVRRRDGTALPLRLERIERRMRIDRTTALTGKIDPITGRTFPEPPDDPRVVYAELVYDFEGQRPETLTIAPPLGPDGIPRVTIGFITFDRGVPVSKFAYLSAPETLTLDWSDPWFSRFDSPNLRRHHQSGITTYLYVEPRELRHETLIRVREIDPWLGLDLQTGQQLTPEDQARIKAQAVELLARRNPVAIDGSPVAPESARAELLTIDTASLSIVEGDRDVSVDEVFAGVILSFPWRDLPEDVVVQWDMFNDTVINVPATATDPVGPFLTGARPDDPEIAWRNHLLTYKTPTVTAVPTAGAGRVEASIFSGMALAMAVAAAVLALRRKGTARIAALGITVAGIVITVLGKDVLTITIRNPLDRAPDIVQATSAFAALLDNINVANLEITADERRAALTPLVPADALPDVAPELDRALAVRVPGGGVARVTEVRGLALDGLAPIGRGFGFQALAEWTALANAGHWGHTHRRVVEYRALVEVIEESGHWKLDGITVLEARLPDA